VGDFDPEECRRLTIFVHGFLNDEFKALKHWDDDIWPVIKGLIKRRTCDIMLFFWPSDTDIIKIFSAADYPRRVETAISAGAELGEYLKKIAELNPHLRVQLVGHSLGCRVVLSAVQQLAEEPSKVPVVRVLLMGAAVPEGDCTASGPWPKKASELFNVSPGPWPKKVSELFNVWPDREAARNSDVILYSRDDEILGWKFRLGEHEARRRGLRSSDSKAVGLLGGPGPKRWTEEVDSCGLKHSDYEHYSKPLIAAQLGYSPDTLRNLVTRRRR